MAQASARSEPPSSEGGGGGGEEGKSLKEKGNEFFKAGNYLKAAALYTQAIKQDPNNPTLYRFPLITSMIIVSYVESYSLGYANGAV